MHLLALRHRTFTIVTTDANALVAELHDRRPVIIAKEDRKRWLTRGEVPTISSSLTRPSS